MKSKLQTFLVLIAIIAIAVVGSQFDTSKHEADKKLQSDHVCVDPTHITCDGKCDCDGMECEKDETIVKYNLR